MVKIIECPRDAMQGLKEFIPTEVKVDYINTLLQVGFDTLDFGSFVSPRHVPQMKDTVDVLKRLDLSDTKTRLSAIVANVRGAENAAPYSEINFLGFPFSISETFQQRNTNSSIQDSLSTVARIMEICEGSNKEFVCYLSMAFGNPYNDPWSIEVAEKWVTELDKLGVRFISLSDTVGVATPETITYFFQNLTGRFPDIEFGAHFHTTPDSWREKVEPAYRNGCKRFDGAIKGFGGCPMAKDDLVGNMPTENLVSFFEENKEETGLDMDQFAVAVEKANKVFPPLTVSRNGHS